MRYDAPPTLHPGRWMLHRAGIINVWHYTDVEFRAHGGRLILRGTNGAGKSRAMEMLVPFLLDADKRRMDATGAGKVSVEDLMRAGAEGATNRLGYLWLELARGVDDGEPEYLTIGAYIRFSTGTARADVRYFTTGLRVGHDLRLVDEQRVALPREALTDLVGAERITESPEAHREAVRTHVFGLHGDSGRERFDGLRQLLHTLRAPDVGNRIDEGQLPRILRDAMPPLSQASLDAAGEKLDGLTETRQELDRLERSLTLVGTFLGVYQRYSADVLRGAADAVLTAVAEADTTEQAAASAATEVEALASRRAEAIGQQSAHAEAAEQLQTSINGMRSRNIFKTADDLRARDAEVAALGTACDACLGAASTARRSEKDAVEAADAQAGVIRDRAELATHAVQQLHGAAGEAGLAGTGLDRVTATVTSSGAETALVRVDRHGDLATVERPRPAAATISPEPVEVGASGQAIGTAARERGEHAQRRRLEAGRLDEQLRQVEALERDAQSATDRVQQEQTSAQQLADQWAQAAAELSGRWREHIASADAPDPEWPPALAAVLADPDAALSDDPSVFDPEALDRAAEQAARPAVDANTRALAELDQQRRADEQAGAALESEAAELRAARDPLPPDAPWLDPGRGGQPLWRCIDFRADLDGYTRASLEAALLAAGLLTASVTADRAIVAATGEILVSAARPAPGRSLTAALIADPTGPLPTDAVTAVLSAIGLDDDEAPVAVYGDGRWRNGPLRGRHQQRDAGYIGATARAARRAARLAEIDRQLAELAARAEQRRASDADLRERARRLHAWVDGAPRTRSVVTARDAEQRAEQRVEAAQREAARLGALARERRTAWSAEHRVHVETCRLHALPMGEADLGRVAGAARDAERAADTVTSALNELTSAREHHQRLLARLDGLAEQRHTAELEAEQAWRAWSGPAAEVAAIHETLDVELAQLTEEITRSEQALRRERQRADEQRSIADRLTQEHTDASSAAAVARETARVLRETAVDRERRLRRVVALPGLVAAATDATLPTGDATELATAVTQVVVRHGHPASDQVLIAAFQTFDREIQGRLDVRDSPVEGVHLIEVTGSGDDRTLAGAHRELTARVEKGRQALSERERDVFTRFVLGGVAEELRTRLAQAETLIAAMNDSLASVRTSHNVGVSLRWQLADGADEEVKRIKSLVARADEVRSEAQNEELTGLLRRRVEALHALDPSSGYAAHLAQALDYRQWHGVEVTILGPEPDQRRRLSKRAKLSQGETRFVSYVTLFAAADGFLRGLPDPRGLRLILLDDAFAKVDEPTVAELMGLLVRLDLDFVMTGHALWGCYPQVPSVDVYEVRRREGGPAITTHVHWDGTTRHLLAAG